VKLLLVRGADVNAKTDHGWTALMAAYFGGHREVMANLRAFGADMEGFITGSDPAHTRPGLRV
jgi:ankyrin repeat protein